MTLTSAAENNMAVQARVAVVTGANKGVGFGIVRGLCKRFDGDVILTSRDVGRGEEEVKQLEKEGLKPKFHQLDVLQTSSIRALKDFLAKQYGGLDLLVNNAGIKVKGTDPFAVLVEVTLRTIFWALLEVSEELFPLLRPHARVVNLTSLKSGTTIKRCSPELQAKIKDPNITLDQLKQMMTEFTNLAKEGKHNEAGWPYTAYGVSKIGVRVLTAIQQRQIDSQGKEDILVNCCCPGYVATDMTRHKGELTIDEGAETPVMVALIPPNASSPRGQYLTKKKVEEWP